MNKLLPIFVGLLATAKLAFAGDGLIMERSADGQPADRNSDDLPVFRLTHEAPVERTDEWFHANHDRPDLILDYVRHQVRIPVGRHYTWTGQEFVEMFTQFTTQAHTDAALLDGLALVFSFCGDKDNAVKHLLRANRLEPKNADHCFNLAAVYAVPTTRPADKATARMWYDRAIQLGAERDDSLEKLMK